MEPNAITYTTLIDGFMKSNQIQQALKAFQAVQHKGVELNVAAYTTLIDGCIKSSF